MNLFEHYENTTKSSYIKIFKVYINKQNSKFIIPIDEIVLKF